jgi:chemotaxis protein methyltransferase CheR
MPITDLEFIYVRKLLHDISAISIEPGQEYLVESRLGPLAAEYGLKSVGELLARLKTEPGDVLQQRIVQAMTTNETLFFRDDHPFEALRLEILPELVQKRIAERKLSIWCSACSTGQEPYSIAMLLREHFPQLLSWNVEILGTDISQDALARARDGRYTQMEVNRGLPGHLLLKYFQPVGNDWMLKDEVKKMVSFRYLNLAQSWPLVSSVDLIFLRNVLIYFTVPMKREILAKARRYLKRDGFLFLGTAETTLNLDGAYEQVFRGKATCYRARA